ncbi:MAG: thiosulfate oxidation carrier complex protein SoxZ [Betaproteobacteria bacterium]
MSLARLQLPPQVTHGQVVRARLLVEHPMDTGYLQDLTGKLVPRNVIRELSCDYGGRQVFRVEPSSGISGNPFFEFFFRADETGELRVSWLDERGEKGELRQLLRVQPPSSRPPA